MANTNTPIRARWTLAIAAPIAAAIVLASIFSIFIYLAPTTKSNYDPELVKSWDKERFALMRQFITSTILINGGAIVAILTLLGHWLSADKKGAQALVVPLMPCLACFALALLATLIGVITWYYDIRTVVHFDKTSVMFAAVERICIFLTLCYFANGALLSMCAFKDYVKFNAAAKPDAPEQNYSKTDAPTD